MAGQGQGQKVYPGRRLRISAEDFNSFVDAARETASRAIGAVHQPRSASRYGDLILVENDSGADQGRFNVLAIWEPIISPEENEDEFARRPAVKGLLPTTQEGRFVVLAEPVAAGEIGLARASGLCIVKVNVTDTAHKYADVAYAQSGYLASGDSGVAVILWKESGTGVKWAIVRIGGGGGGEVAGSGFPTKIITPLGSGAYTVKEQVASAAKTFGDKPGASNITAYNLAEIAGSECSSQIAANAIVWVRKHVSWYYFERATNARYKA